MCGRVNDQRHPRLRSRSVEHRHLSHRCRRRCSPPGRDRPARQRATGPVRIGRLDHAGRPRRCADRPAPTVLTSTDAAHRSGRVVRLVRQCLQRRRRSGSRWPRPSAPARRAPPGRSAAAPAPPARGRTARDPRWACSARSQRLPSKVGPGPDAVAEGDRRPPAAPGSAPPRSRAAGRPVPRSAGTAWTPPAPTADTTIASAQPALLRRRVDRAGDRHGDADRRVADR